MNIGERIKAKRQQIGMTQDDLAAAVGYKSRSSVNKIESGERDLTQSMIAAFAKALKTTPSYIMGWEEPSSQQPSKIDNIRPIKKVRLPVLGEIACGEPVYADEERELYVDVDDTYGADFCLIAKGDSMINARINDGDIVFIRSQDIVDDGEIAAVIIDDEATLKRFYYYKNENKVVLQAENPRYKPLVYVGDELEKFRVLGKAVAFQSRL